MKDKLLGPAGSNNYREYAGNINYSGATSAHLINDILDISKFSAGKDKLEESVLSILTVMGGATKPRVTAGPKKRYCS